MNIEETKECIRIMQAFVDGKEVEHRYNGMWVKIYVPRWDWDNTEYRIKPTAKLRPWTADEVPVGAILRYKRNNQSIRMLIVCSYENGLCGYKTEFPYAYLRDEMEHSADLGKTWHPCGVMEEAK
jgi:hypothetical protein